MVGRPGVSGTQGCGDLSAAPGGGCTEYLTSESIIEMNRNKPQKPVLALLLLLLTWLSPVVGATPVWQGIGPTGGDQFKVVIAPHDPDLLLSVAHYAIHRSTDGGLSWQAVHNRDIANGDVLDVAFDPTSPSRLYAAGASTGVWVSDDEGLTWQACSEGLPRRVSGRYFPAISLAFDGAGTLYAGLAETLAEGLPPALVYRLGTDCTVGWTAADAGVVLSGGTRYQRVNTLLHSTGTGGVIASIYGGGVFSLEAGSWVARNGDLPTSALLATHFGVDALDDQHWVLGTDRDWVWETRDGGSTWTQFPVPVELQGLAVLPLVYHLDIDPNNPRFLQVQLADSAGSVERPLFRPAPEQDSGAMGFYSGDGGLTWIGVQTNTFRMTVDPRDVFVGPVQGVGELSRSAVRYVTGGGAYSLQKSVDGGLTYTPYTDGLSSILINEVWFKPGGGSGPGVLFAAAESGLFRFDAATGEWSRRPATSSTIYSWSFAVVPGDTGSLYYSTGNPAWNTPLNRGVWRLALDCFAADCPPADQLLSDVGVWKVITTDLQPDTIYAATQERGVMVSRDRGLTWSELNAGIPLPASITDLLLDEVSGEPLFAAARTLNGIIDAESDGWQARSGEGGALYRWNDVTGGWEPVGGFTQAIMALDRDPRTGRLYAGTVEGVYLSDDGGDSWQVVWPSTVIQDVKVDPVREGYVYAASSTGVLRSTTGGEQWHLLTEGLTMDRVLSLTVDPDAGTLYAGTGGNSVFRLDPDPNPVASLVPGASSIDFGVVPYGFSTTAELVIENTGEAPLVVDAMTVSGAGFSVEGVTLPLQVMPMSRAVVTLRFSPSATGSHAADLVLSSNDAVAPTQVVALTGTGRDPVPPAPDLKVAGLDGPVTFESGTPLSATVDLGSPGDYVGQDAEVWLGLTLPDGSAWWYTDTGGWVSSVAPLPVRQVVLREGAVPLAFSLPPLPTGTSRLVSSVDTTLDGVMDGVWSDAVDVTMLPAPPVLVLSTTAVDFGGLVVGERATRKVLLGNGGEADLLIESLQITGGEFVLESPPTLPLTVPAQGGVELLVSYVPTVAGSHAAALEIGTNDPLQAVATVDLSGSARDPLPVVPLITVNGVAGGLTIAADVPAKVAIELDAGDHRGEPAEWWLRAETPFGTYWMVKGGSWTAQVDPLLGHEGPIVPISNPFTVLNRPLPPGVYTFTFVVDGTIDGSYSEEWLDTVVLTVQ